MKAELGDSFESDEELEALKEEFNLAKETLKKNLKERRAEILASYTEEELDIIEDAKDEIEDELQEGIELLSVDSIISNKGGFKFDTPPVIKNGRTKIPVRAVSEGFGADVSWDGENNIVTITKGDTIIELPLDSNLAIVNGEEIEFDSKSEMFNSRTYVPLRFISETLDIEVEWDSETGTIELDDSDDEELEEDTSEYDTLEESLEDDSTEE